LLRVLLAAFVFSLLCGATPLSAQIRGRPVQQSNNYGWWFSGGAGAASISAINDGASSSTWNFGTDPLWQFRGTLERAIDDATTIGVSAGYGVVDVILTPFSTTAVPTLPGQTPVCTLGCDGEVQLWSLMGQFRSGGGTGFHTLFEASGGVTGFRNLRTKDTKEAIGAAKGQYDITGTLGAGFGYPLSRDMVIAIVQDFGIGLHAKDDLPSGMSRTYRVRNLRASLRFAFGDR
jgi:hypothetical protein